MDWATRSVLELFAISGNGSQGKSIHCCQETLSLLGGVSFLLFTRGYVNQVPTSF